MPWGLLGCRVYSGHRNLLIWMLYQNLQAVQNGHHTLNVFYRRLIWSFQCLWDGEEAVTDWRGRPIPGAIPGKKLMDGVFMCLWALPCDLDHCFKCYGMPCSNSNHPCGLCPVDASGMPWFDFRVNADWIGHIYTVQSWLAAGMKRCILFDIIGVSILSFYPDWMHCKSLGIDKILIG